MRLSHVGHGGRRVACAASLALALLAAPAAAGRPAPAGAQAGLDLARAAAVAWAEDAELVYLENDEALDAGGAAARWGYLFVSPSRRAGRAWSVRDGRIVAAEDLAMRFEAPPLAAGWIDSGAAVEAAARAVRRELKGAPSAPPAAMLLMRGAFQDEDPDATTWTLVYQVPGAPSLFVMVDAADGRVRRTWRG
jgi:hypothetical protein